MNLIDVERVHPLHDGTRRHATVDPDSLPHTPFLPARTTPFRQSLPSRVGMIAMRSDFTMPSDSESFSRVWLSTQLPERRGSGGRTSNAERGHSPLARRGTIYLNDDCWGGWRPIMTGSNRRIIEAIQTAQAKCA